VPSQPDFVLHVGEASPSWADVELLFEHTESPPKTAVVTDKFSQWLRNAWSIFYHQPFRRHLYGILFLKHCTYICYADHGSAVYSEPLYFVDNSEHTRFLGDFFSGFIANQECRGRDPTVEEEWGNTYIHYAGEKWRELSNGLLWYRPNLVGRHTRVAWMETQANFPERRLVMKSTWEEKLPPESSPPPEAEVLDILLKAGVRGLPQVYHLDCAMVRNDDNSEVETKSFPENCKLALPAATDDRMASVQRVFTSERTMKYWVTTEGPAAEPFTPELKVRRHNFNEPIKVRRRLTRIIMSYCQPLTEAMRGGGPILLMKIIRDAMIVYYEAYKRPEHGFIHGGKRSTIEFYVFDTNQ